MYMDVLFSSNLINEVRQQVFDSAPLPISALPINIPSQSTDGLEGVLNNAEVLDVDATSDVLEASSPEDSSSEEASSEEEEDIYTWNGHPVQDRIPISEVQDAFVDELIGRLSTSEETLLWADDYGREHVRRFFPAPVS